MRCFDAQGPGHPGLVSLAELNPVASLRPSRRQAKTVPLRPRTAAVAPESVAGPRSGQWPGLRARRYWIEHCEGFRVDGHRGRIGVVEEVRRPRHGHAVLVIRTGLLGRRMVEISVTEVFEIVPRSRRLWLRTPEALRHTTVVPEPLEPLRARSAA